MSGRKHTAEARAKISATKRWFKDLSPDERRAAQTQRRTQIKTEWRQRNRERIKDEARAAYACDPHKARLARVLWRFGLTPVQWLAIIHFQGNRCACCRSNNPRSVHGWHVDHDHVTGVVRGALCHKCNTVLGMLGDRRDDVVTSSAMYIRYLTRTENA